MTVVLGLTYVVMAVLLAMTALYRRFLLRPSLGEERERSSINAERHIEPAIRIVANELKVVGDTEIVKARYYNFSIPLDCDGAAIMAVDVSRYEFAAGAKSCIQGDIRVVSTKCEVPAASGGNASRGNDFSVRPDD